MIGAQHASCLALAVAGAALGASGCRRGGSSAAAKAEGATIAWSVELGAVASRAGLAVADDGTIYVAGYAPPESPPPGHASAEGFRQVCLYAVDAQGQVTRRLAGTVTWDMPEVWVRVAPWGAAYAIDALGGIYGLLPGGRARFNEAGVRLAGPIAIDHRGLLYAGGPGGVHVLELEAQDPLSLFASTGSSHASAPVVGPDGTAYYTSTHGGRLIASSEGGGQLWERRASGYHPVLAPDGMIYLSDRTRLRAFATNGEPMWEFDAETALGTPPALAPDGSVYVATRSGLVHSIERGRSRWSFPLERPVHAELRVDAAGVVFAADEIGKVYAIAPDGTRLWSRPLPVQGGTPVPGPDGTVYAVDGAGRLHAIVPPTAGE